MLFALNYLEKVCLIYPYQVMFALFLIQVKKKLGRGNKTDSIIPKRDVCLFIKVMLQSKCVV